MAGSDAAFTEHQSPVNPRALYRILEISGKVRYRCRAAGQAIERVRHILRQTRRVDFETPDDVVNVGILRLQYLLQPVFQLYVGIATKLAEHRRAFHRFVRKAVQLTEQSNAADFSHVALPP